MSDETANESSEFRDTEPVTKGRAVEEGLPKFLQGGQFVMLFGAKRSPQTPESTGPAKSDGSEGFGSDSGSDEERSTVDNQ